MLYVKFIALIYNLLLEEEEIGIIGGEPENDAHQSVPGKERSHRAPRGREKPSPLVAVGSRAGAGAGWAIVGEAVVVHE